jgi:phage N-6-adenine-methyltransferase
MQGSARSEATVSPLAPTLGLVSIEDAEEYTQSLAQIFSGSWRQVLWADRQGIPDALGLSTQEWVTQRLGGYVRLAIDERREAVAELVAEGLSQRDIADVLGVDAATVNRDLRPPVANATPEPESDPKSQVAERPEPDPVANATAEPELSPTKAHVANNSGDNEWYTPAEYIKAATAVTGAIDLDPASSAAANEVVGAAEFYNEEDDGLTQPWQGRVWMNPPYAQPLVDRFCTRVAREFKDGAVTEACVLVNNGTETNWFQEMAAQASAICFPRGRLRFWHPDKPQGVPLQGQAVIYLGANTVAFRSEFLRFGFVVMR